MLGCSDPSRVMPSCIVTGTAVHFLSSSDVLTPCRVGLNIFTACMVIRSIS